MEKRCYCKESFLFSSFKNTSWLWRAWTICQNLLVWLREAASGNATQAAMFALSVSTVWNTLPSLHLNFQTSNYSYLTLSNGTCFSTELSFRYLMANEEHSGLKRTLMSKQANLWHKLQGRSDKGVFGQQSKLQLFSANLQCFSHIISPVRSRSGESVGFHVVVPAAGMLGNWLQYFDCWKNKCRINLRNQ